MRTVFPAFCTDEAAEWLQRLDPRRGMGPVDGALRGVAESPDPRASAARAEIALVAAELVAAIHGHPHHALPAAGVDWVAAQGGPHAVRTDGDFDALVTATRALDLIVTSSQLSDARSNEDADESWRTALDDLRMRLAAAGGMPRSKAAR